MRAAFAAGALALAPLLALQALTNSGGNAPNWASAWNGFRLAETSLSHIGARIEENQVVTSIDPRAIELAKKAYLREPFASDAHFILGLTDETNQGRLYQASREIDPRNQLTGLALLQYAATSGDLPAMLNLMDRLSRIDPTLAGEIVGALSNSLEDPAALPVLEASLRAQPHWASAFWKSVPADEKKLDNYLLLRDRVRPPLEEEANARLIRALVRSGRHDLAFAIRDRLARDSNFPPLDWELATSRQARARLEKGEFKIFVEADWEGELATRLVKLEPGQYKIAARVIPGQGTGIITAHLRCTSANEKSHLKAELKSGFEVWEVPEGICNYAWLSIRGSAWGSATSFRATIRGFSLRPLKDQDDPVG